MSPRRKYRPLKFAVTRVTLREGAGGVRYMKAEQPLARTRAAPDRPPGALGPRRARPHLHGAPRPTTPTARPASGATFPTSEALDSARRIGQALIDRGLGAERPVAILSENDLEHALLALGCLYAGVPYCPVSPAYSTISQDYDKLRHVLGTLTPGLVFAADAARYGKAIAATVGPDVEVVLADGTLRGRETTPFAALLATTPTSGRRRRHAGHRPRHHRQVPVHLRLDQAAQGRDQHPRHVVRQPAADAPVDAGAGRGAAGAGGLAALEPHLRRQPQLRPDALQRRHALHRRRQAGAGPDGRDAAQPARDRAHGLLQRAHRLRGDRQRDEDGRRAAPQPAVARARCFSMPARRWPSRSGTPCTRCRSARSASASSWAPAWA